MGIRQSLPERLHKALPSLARRLLETHADLLPVSSDVPVLEVSFPNSERLPIYVTDAGAQVLCICYLWRDQDILPERRSALLETLLDLNPSVPLSSFGRIGAHHVLFGSINPAASSADLALELATLSENAVDALATLAEYLR